MMNKTFRLTKALRNETAKRVPIILVIFAVLLLWQNYVSGQTANAALKQANATAEQIKVNSARRDKSQDEQLRNIKQDNANQTLILCKVFLSNGSEFSATDVQQIEAICKEKIKQNSTFVSQPSGTSVTSPQKPSQSSPSSPQSAPKENNGQSNNSQPEQPKPLNCKLDVLSLHIGCP